MNSQGKRVVLLDDLDIDRLRMQRKHDVAKVDEVLSEPVMHEDGRAARANRHIALQRIDQDQGVSPAEEQTLRSEALNEMPDSVRPSQPKPIVFVNSSGEEIWSV